MELDYNFYKKKGNYTYMEVRNGQGVEKIELNRVLYFASDVRVVEAHMETGKVFCFYDKLDDVQKRLTEDEWLRCHKSFLVNRKWIRQIKREYISVAKEKVPVSRNYYQQFRKMGLIGKEHNKIEITGATKQQKIGIVHCVCGKYEGMDFYIYPNEKLVFGRGYDQADLVFEEEGIDAEHCWIQYNNATDSYFVCNRSLKGIYINDTMITEYNMVREAALGTQLRLAQTEQIFEIG